MAQEYMVLEFGLYIELVCPGFESNMGTTMGTTITTPYNA